jgi:putative transposase
LQTNRGTLFGMQLRYRYRCYPTPGQVQALARSFGCARVVWNDALALSTKLYGDGQKYPGSAALQSLVITAAKRTPERAWLAEASHSMLQQSVRDLDRAFRNWWGSLTGKHKGKARAPRFKRRHAAQSIRICGRQFRVTARGVRFPKVGDLALVWSRPLPAAPSSCTLIRDAAGRFFASFVVEVERDQLEPNGNTVGIDLGLATFATLSTGEKIDAPKPLRTARKRLRKLSRHLSRKVKGSNRRNRARVKVARLHARIADTRKDFLDKLSTRIIRENQTVVLEDLRVSGMIRNRRLARSIADVGWRAFRLLLESKAAMYGRTVQVISTWEPTSQRCSCCGELSGKKPLGIRQWTCLHCGAEHDRDINAANNIAAAGLVEAQNGRGAKRQTGLPAAGCEASTRREVSSHG